MSKKVGHVPGIVSLKFFPRYIFVTINNFVLFYLELTMASKTEEDVREDYSVLFLIVTHKHYMHIYKRQIKCLLCEQFWCKINVALFFPGT